MSCFISFVIFIRKLYYIQKNRVHDIHVDQDNFELSETNSNRSQIAKPIVMFYRIKVAPLDKRGVECLLRNRPKNAAQRI